MTVAGRQDQQIHVRGQPSLHSGESFLCVHGCRLGEDDVVMLEAQACLPRDRDHHSRDLGTAWAGDHDDTPGAVKNLHALLE